ncbi:MAG TPA: hypothetical protein VGZ24_00700 [Chthoniobacterales bacterium]|jgi:hypothetical protein|nr:hypothetical protein [Chthoniobacterales bacterium]
MIAVHFENLLFLLFVAGAFLFQLLARAASKTSKNADESQRRSTSRPQTPPPIPRGPAETDEERIRKFLEALGQPTTSKPPPPVMPRPTYQKPVILPHVGPFASPLPPLTTRPPDLPRKIGLPGQLTPTHKTKTSTSKTAEPFTFEAYEGPPSESPPTIDAPAEADVIATRPVLKPEQSKTDIAVLLTSTSGLRNAIILREVFGPPRSLQPLDLIGSI